MTEMYRVSKVLNNNGVIAIDMDENKEYVILGKGVGFGKKVSQRFDKPEGCKKMFLLTWLKTVNGLVMVMISAPVMETVC